MLLMSFSKKQCCSLSSNYKYPIFMIARIILFAHSGCFKCSEEGGKKNPFVHNSFFMHLGVWIYVALCWRPRFLVTTLWGGWCIKQLLLLPPRYSKILCILMLANQKQFLQALLCQCCGQFSTSCTFFLF